MQLKYLGPVLRELRRKKGLPAIEVSRRLNMSIAYVNNIEHGHDLPSGINLLKLAEIYEAKPGQLLSLARKDALARKAEQLRDEHAKLLKEWKNNGREEEGDPEAVAVRQTELNFKRAS